MQKQLFKTNNKNISFHKEQESALNLTMECNRTDPELWNKENVFLYNGIMANKSKENGVNNFRSERAIFKETQTWGETRVEICESDFLAKIINGIRKTKDGEQFIDS
jgi:hypothetical protein